jgi:hypothetical protein
MRLNLKKIYTRSRHKRIHASEPHTATLIRSAMRAIHPDYGRIDSPKECRQMERMEAIGTVLVTGIHILFLLSAISYGIVLYVRLKPLSSDAMSIAGKPFYTMPPSTMNTLSSKGKGMGNVAKGIQASINKEAMMMALTQPAVQSSIASMQLVLADMKATLKNATAQFSSLKTVAGLASKNEVGGKVVATYPWPASKPGIASMMRNAVHSVRAGVDLLTSIRPVVLYDTLFHLWPMDFTRKLVALQARLGENLKMLGVSVSPAPFASQG